ncbi:MAG: hypothetical protein KUG56_04505 [Kordiimonadaceae bacterium]|nr:hypothetical protein [Kordiimonadaceae bacterium]
MLDPNILIWPDNHTYQAFERTPKFAEADEGLHSLYLKMHTRTGLTYDPAKAEALFEKETSAAAQQNIPLNRDSEDIPLTIVTVSRNDEHVERMRERSQAFIDGVIFLAEKFQTKTELILVEWNPPVENPLMAEQFSYPENHPYVSVVIITVPKKLHDQYITGANMPLYQMIGKNVGIRRARGRFVVATNIDVLLSEALFSAIVKPDLAAGNLYRSNRWDIDRKILDEANAGDMISAAESMTFQVQYRAGTQQRDTANPHHEPEKIIVAGNRTEQHLLPQLHTMACGDFQMMARDDWFTMRGYAELDGYSFHLDSLFALMCHYQGFNEHVFSDECPHFHIDHTLGQEAKSDTYIMQNNKALKHISFGGLIFLNTYMADAGTPHVNRSNWGLSQCDLPISHVCRANWEQEAVAYTIQADTAATCLVDLQKLEGFSYGVISDWVASTLKQLTQFIAQRLKGREFYIWGPGGRGQILAAELSKQGIEVAGFIQGGDAPLQQIEGCPYIISAPQELLKPENRKPFIGIATIYADEVCAELEAKGWIEGRDYIVMV